MTHLIAPLIAPLTITGLCLATMGGWSINIWSIVSSVGEPLNGMFVARCVGAFVAPLGAILGYF